MCSSTVSRHDDYSDGHGVNFHHQKRSTQQKWRINNTKIMYFIVDSCVDEHAVHAAQWWDQKIENETRKRLFRFWSPLPRCHSRHTKYLALHFACTSMMYWLFLSGKHLHRKVTRGCRSSREPKLFSVASTIDNRNYCYLWGEMGTEWNGMEQTTFGQQKTKSFELIEMRGMECQGTRRSISICMFTQRA